MCHVLAALARVETGCDLAKRAIASQCDDRAVGASLQRRTHRAVSSCHRATSAADRRVIPTVFQQGERPIDALLVLPALRGRVTDDEMSGHHR